MTVSSTQRKFSLREGRRVVVSTASCVRVRMCMCESEGLPAQGGSAAGDWTPQSRGLSGDHGVSRDGFSGSLQEAIGKWQEEEGSMCSECGKVRNTGHEVEMTAQGRGRKR